MKKGIAGTFESNDCIIEVVPNANKEIEIESIVVDFFKEQIEAVINKTLADMEITKVKVICKDKGALDYTIRARLITALNRMEESDA